MRSARLLIAALAVVSMAVSACGSSPDTSATTPEASPSASAAVDCAITLNAMGDYGTAVLDLAASVQANDSMSAIAAADAMLYAIDQLMPAIQAVGEPAEEFAAHAWAVAALVKSSAANGTSMQEALPKITEAFKDPAFDTGGDALQGYVDTRCPAPAQE
ncbi:MAG: hypothetical protein ACKO70_10400 [Actinomycetota bacterium]